MQGEAHIVSRSLTVVECVALLAEKLRLLPLAHHDLFQPVVVDLTQKCLSLLGLRRHLRARHRGVAQKVQNDLKVLRVSVIWQERESARMGSAVKRSRSRDCHRIGTDL